MNGKIVGGAIVAIGLIAGVAMYYLQVYAFYEPVSARGSDDVRMTSLVTGQAETVLYENFRAIDADSSPLRYRACFDTVQSLAMMTETYSLYEGATPLTGPGWFDCYDAAEVDNALASGRAIAFLGEANTHYGVDRVVAVFDDGRAVSWHQMNACGEEVFNGRPAPAGCPPEPQKD